MHLARHHALTSHPPAPAFLHAAFFHQERQSDAAATDIITCATPSGFFVAQTSPFSILSRRSFSPSQGVLSLVVPVEHSSLLLLVGGGRVPRFAPNKLVLWDEAAVVSPAQKQHQQPSLGRATAPAAPAASSDPRLSFSSSSQSSHPADADSIRDIDDDDEDNGNDNVSSASSFSNDHHSGSSSEDGIDPSMYLSAVYHSTAASKPTLEMYQPPPPPQGDVKGKGKAKANPAPASVHVKTKPASVPRPNLGSAVAELEFAEAVTGVEIYPFDLPAATTPAAVAAKSYIIVVVLRTKAAVFELGPAQLLQKHQPQTGTQSSPSAQPHEQGLSIINRTTVDISGAARQGLVAIAPASSPATNNKRPKSKAATTALIALPGRQKGHVQLVRVPVLCCATQSAQKHADSDPSQPLNIGASTIIIAHSSALNSITLSPCGRMLVTSSDRGTLVRLWSVRGDPIQFGSKAESQSSTRSAPTLAPANNPTLIREVRRGSDQAYILSVAIAPDLSALAVASDKGTIHIFRLALSPGADPIPKKEAHNSDTTRTVKTSTSSSSFPIPKALKKATSLTRKHLLPTATSSLSALPGSNQLKKYLASEWSTAHFRIPLRTFGGRSAEAAWGERGGPGGVETPHVRVPLKKASSLAGSGSATSTSRPAVEDVGMMMTEEDEQQASASPPEPGRRLHQPVEAMAGGSARSTEGGWAAMRARIEDVRRGEAGLDEKIFLTWTRARSADGCSQESDSITGAVAEGGSKYELVVLTTGGGWYRLGLPDTNRKPQSLAKGAGEGETLHQARPQRAGSSISGQRAGADQSDPATGATQQAREDRELEKSGMISGCTLLEYRRFGQRDEWEQ